ncbi:MAG: tetratricopeptide repeat protein, partial [Candidatus Omnitrophota bacterium]
LQLARAFHDKRFFENSMLESKKVLEAEPENSGALLILGASYLSMGQTKEARAQFEKMVRLDPENAWGNIYLAKIDLDEGEAERCITRARNFLAGDPDQHLLRNILGTAYARKKDYDEAEKIFKKIMRENPEFTVARINLIQLYYRSDRSGEAVEAAKAFLEEQPDSPEARFILAVSYRKDGKLEDALRELEALIEARTYNAAVLLEAAETYRGMGDNEKTEEYYNLTIAAEPRLIRPYVGLATLYEEMGNEKAAMTQYEVLLQLTNRPPSIVYNNLAALYAKHREKLREALDIAKQAVSLSPEDGLVLDTLGWLYYLNGLYDQAIETLEQAKRLESDHPAAYYHLGIVQYEIGDLANAAQNLGRAISRVSAEFPEANNAERIKAAVVFEQQGMRGEALGELKAILGDEPENAVVLLAMAKLYDTMGMKEDAIFYYEKALMARPSLTKARVRLDEIYRELGGRKAE